MQWKSDREKLRELIVDCKIVEKTYDESFVTYYKIENEHNKIKDQIARLESDWDRLYNKGRV